MRVLIAALSFIWIVSPAPPVLAETPDRDPRNWPTVARLVADRHELAGRVISLRVHAKRSDFYACGYRQAAGTMMAFTLLGGPMQTLTGYIPRSLGRVLERELEDDPWLPITVQVRFDPAKLSNVCTDQVEILKWSRSWQYPPGSLTPGRADRTLMPSREVLESKTKTEVWSVLTGRPRKRAWMKRQLQEEDILSHSVQVTAGARVSTAYHCMFRNATDTHYAIRLHDHRGNFLHAYLPRTAEARQFMNQIALHRDVLVSVKGTVVKQTPSRYCRAQLDVTEWTLVDNEQ